MSAATEVRRASAAWDDGPGDVSCPRGAMLTDLILVEEVCPPGAVYAPPPQPYLILYRTGAGRATVQAGALTFTHERGSLVAVAPGCPLVETVGAEEPWHLCYLLVRGAWAEQLGTVLQMRALPVLTLASPSARHRQLFSDLFDLGITQPDGWQWRFTARLAELTGLLLGDARADSPGDSLTARIGQIVDADPCARLTPEQMARQVNLTARQLTYEFHKATGESLAGWVRRRRIARARRLLGQGQSVRDVAEQLGFATPSHFSRVFKAVTGVPPSTLSEQIRSATLHD